MPRTHNYEEEYDEYDGWLDITGSDSHTQLRYRIESTFGLNPVSARKLADQLWKIKVRQSQEEEIERELGLPPTPPLPREFSPRRGLTTITEWRKEAKRKGLTEDYTKRIESHLRRYPRATLKEARGKHPRRQRKRRQRRKR